MKDKLKKLLYDCCITSSAAIKEIGISRNAFYSEKVGSHPGTSKFIETHKNDWKFSPQILKDSVIKSGKSQTAICEEIEVHLVTFNNFIKGKLRPTRATGDYEKVMNFCNGRVKSKCSIGRMQDNCAMFVVNSGKCEGCRHYR